eukprot:TRINITY_DN3381_c0_g1_i6.p1 TRINITY_DN3381_c0_g1~~TRINITY_DN3381_c0_g1_i6.p1  ORF type:complete len:221 (+),score=16.89 TRINITY_DN3381_c0_g1_i6:194-856(+)
MSPLIAVSRDVWRHAGVRRAEATGSRCRSGGMMKQILGGMDQLSKKAQSDPSAMCSMQSFSYARKTGPDNKPHVVQKCSSMRRAKGVSERKDLHSDSHTGFERMSVQRGLGDRSRKIARGRSRHGAQQVQDDVFENLQAEDAPQFDQEWEQAARSAGLARQAKMGFTPQICMSQGRNGSRSSGRNTSISSRRAVPTLRDCLLYTSPSPRDRTRSRMPSSA